MVVAYPATTTALSVELKGGKNSSGMLNALGDFLGIQSGDES